MDCRKTTSKRTSKEKINEKGKTKIAPQPLSFTEPSAKVYRFRVTWKQTIRKLVGFVAGRRPVKRTGEEEPGFISSLVALVLQKVIRPVDYTITTVAQISNFGCVVLRFCLF